MDFSDDSVGSPNGRAAGYFLMQHKEQLGGNKFISKVTVFFPSLPYLVYYVEGPSKSKTLEMSNSTAKMIGSDN